MKILKLFLLTTASINVYAASLPAAVCHATLAASRRATFATAEAMNMRSISSHVEMLPHVVAAVKLYGAENVQIAFDVDDCLTCPEHPAFLPTSYSGKHKATFNAMMEPLKTEGKAEEKKAIVWNLKYTEGGSQLTEDSTPYLLSEFKAMGVRTFGLTASMPGSIKPDGYVNYRHRVGVLHKLGVDFNAPDDEFHIDGYFESAPDGAAVKQPFHAFHDSLPVYYNGVAFCGLSGDVGSATKGEVIYALNQRWGVTPKVVFFVDDSKNNLKRVDHFLRPRGIECQTFLYESALVEAERDISEADYVAALTPLIEIARAVTTGTATTGAVASADLPDDAAREARREKKVEDRKAAVGGAVA